jgi:hypothetical protein
MKKRNVVILLLYVVGACASVRDPFESIIIIPETTSDSENQNNVSLVANNTWQVAHADENVMILKNADGEIRHVELPE